MAAKGVCLNHIARESPDVKRLAKFYTEILGLEVVETPRYEGLELMRVSLPPFFTLHIIERHPDYKLPEAQWPLPDPETLTRGHHVAFSVTNFDEFCQTLTEKGIPYHSNPYIIGDNKQIFFFDPDGNGIEVGSCEPAYKN